MSRIGPCFARLREQGRQALIPYITAGDPEPNITVPLMHAMVEAGADILELGVPFSDPMADGPIIQAAYERALAHRVNLRRVLAMVKEFRARNTTTPVVLMGYLNPIEVMGYQDFATEAAQAGVDGVLTVDMPVEEGGDYVNFLYRQHIDPIFLIAPTSPAERIAKIGQAARGFVYYVSLKGVTGAATLDVAAVAEKLTELRAATTLPVGVGFGIKDPATARQIARIADAVVVGSAIVNAMTMATAGDIAQDVAAVVRNMRQAMDAK